MLSKEEPNAKALAAKFIEIEAIFASSRALKAAIPETKGIINAIWFTSRDEPLNPLLLPNLSSSVASAAAHGFRTIFWTNKDELAPAELEAFRRQGIIVADLSLCSSSSFYPYCVYFLKKGMDGDKTAFALAADILRMALLELFPPKEHFICIDPSRIMLTFLDRRLSDLRSCLLSNSLGFFFHTTPLAHGDFAPSNHVLIALKYINQRFFKDYFAAYLLHLERSYRDYSVLVAGRYPRHRLISESVSPDFFIVDSDSGLLRATFGAYAEAWSLMHSGYALSYLSKKSVPVLSRRHSLFTFGDAAVRTNPKRPLLDPTPVDPYAATALVLKKG